MQFRNHVRGFTLVELMVSMVIGLILLAGISSVFVSSKKSYTANDSLARLQENGRIAMQILTRTLRNTGYYGCADDIKSVTSALNPGSGYQFNIAARLEGATYAGAGSTNWMPSGATVNLPALMGTDLVTVRFLDGSTTVPMVEEMNRVNAELKFDLGTGIKEGDILMLTDCSSADAFQVTGTGSAGGFDHVLHNAGAGSPGNAKAWMSKIYKEDAKLMKFRAISFYVGNGTGGEPALFQHTLTTVSGVAKMQSQELVQGIEEFQIRYGIDTENNDRVPDAYVTAAGVSAGNNWDNVVTMRFGIVARSQANLTTSDRKAVVKDLDSGKYDVDGDGTREYDMSTNTNQTNGVSWRAYERRVFRNTIALRNMQ